MSAHDDAGSGSCSGENTAAVHGDDIVPDAARYKDFRRRTRPIVKFNASNYMAPARLFKGDMKIHDRVGVSYMSMIMRGMVFGDVHSKVDAAYAPYTVLAWPELGKKPMFYRVATQVLVDEKHLTAHYARAKDVRAPVAHPPDASLREQTPDMERSFENLNKAVHDLLLLRVDPVAIAAVIIVGVARARPSLEEGDNVMIGCICTNYILGGHRYPFLVPSDWRADVFIKTAMICADDTRTTHELTAFYIEPLERLIRTILTQVAAMRHCDSCGISEKDYAELTKTPDARIKRCGRCRLVYYCGTGCQKDDEKDHAKFCEDNAVAKQQSEDVMCID